MRMQNPLYMLIGIAEGILPFLFWVLIIFGFDKPYIAVLTILSALIHELGHVLAFLFFDGRVTLKSHLSGFRIKNYGMGYAKEILALAAGPLINLAIFVLLSPLSKSPDGYMEVFGYINLLTALSNLLPIEGYDGYGIMKKSCEALNLSFALRALPFISFSLTVLFTFFSLYLLLIYGEGYWICAIFFLLLIEKITEFTKRG